MSSMQIDIKKVMGNTPDNVFEASDMMIKAQQDVLEALHIMQSTVDFFEDKECLELNKKRMVKYLNKFTL